ncbi:MAG: glutamate formimidoyltransferase [Gemmatimonadota bacterium]|nr:glutamate formimidoyltransferase [Gemmatimonadota bacterium]
MRKIVECVPNFSEGRNQETIEAIAAAVRATPGCTVLDVDPGASTNRTVYTFVGDPAAVVVGALNAARVARDRIDMRTHTGEHPRMGAMDVCPFVPVSGVTMEDCVACANQFGRRAAEELGIPVYLYEEASQRDARRSLKDIRAGEYEALEEKLGRPEWKPDFGPAEFVPRWGATAVGARFFLIAYNVNVLGTKEQAHRIALDVREQGRGPDEPGLLQKVKGIGWYVDEYGMAQVSMNLDDYRVTPPHVAFEACMERGKALNVAVTGSELVGLVPREAMLMAADYYVERENLFILEERQKIRLAVERLGLNSIAPFDPDTRIIEYMVSDANVEPLASSSVRSFIEALGARTASPGGGSAAAAIAAIGAALGSMVGWMTYGRRKFESLDPVMRKNIPPVYHAMQNLIRMIDADTKAFGAYMSALSLPQRTAEERATREHAMQDGLKRAVEVPLATMQTADTCWDALAELARHGGLSMRSDLEVGARALEMGIWGAYRNVLINLGDIEEEAFCTRVRSEAEGLAARAKEQLARVTAVIDAR